MPLQRQKICTIYLTSKEDADIKAEADKLGISVNAFFRLLFKQWIDGIRFEKEKAINEINNGNNNGTKK